MGYWCLYCDYFWNIHSGLQCALCCGWCFNGEECGLSYTNFNTSPEYARWDVGACCDDFRSNLSGLRHALYGGWCEDSTRCGLSYLSVGAVPELIYWSIGACLEMTYFYAPKKERTHNRLRSFLFSLFQLISHTP